MATPPPLSPPRWGEPITEDAAYVKRPTAERQADHWTAALADDPLLGPDSGFRVGVGPRHDGRYPLVWVPLDESQ
ncbi:MAG: hypothetical protein JWN22_1092 [Nocardioides sp.]|jgi:hypothetical protein|nr:hypothetical protein [Nocardioides sp.]